MYSEEIELKELKFVEMLEMLDIFSVAIFRFCRGTIALITNKPNRQPLYTRQ